MKLLIDTHTALWLFNEHEKLSQAAKDCLLDEKNELYISIVSAWEVAVKNSLGKLPGFEGGVRRFISAICNLPIKIAALEFKHVIKIEELPYIHRDPFDRLLIATALCDDMTIVTNDKDIQRYDVMHIW